MAKITEKYQALVILSTKVGEETVKALIEKISALICKRNPGNGRVANADSLIRSTMRRRATTFCSTLLLLPRSRPSLTAS